MDNQLTPTEIQEVQQILKDYNPAQDASLSRSHPGNIYNKAGDPP